MKYDVTEEDKEMLIRLYKLTDDQIFRVEKMYFSSERSLCACAKLVKQND